MDRELRKRRWIVRGKLEGWTNSTIAEHLRINERTVIRWYNAYKQCGWDGLVIKSRRPYHIHTTLPDVVDEVERV